MSLSTALYTLANESGAKHSTHYFLDTKCQRRVSRIDTSSFVTVAGVLPVSCI